MKIERSCRIRPDAKNTRRGLRRIFCSLLLLVAVVAALRAVASSGLADKAGSPPPTANAPGEPDVVRLFGPVVANTNVRDLPYIPPTPQIPEERLTRYPHSETGTQAGSRTPGFAQFQSLFDKIFRPVPTMPLPLLTFDGINFTQTECAFCYPPDTNGDVGPESLRANGEHLFQGF